MGTTARPDVTACLQNLSLGNGATRFRLGLLTAINVTAITPQTCLQANLIEAVSH